VSRENLAESLDAVEQALEHFAGSLERGGFAAGAPAYRQMAALMIGQRLWASEHRVTELDERYLRVAELALEIYGQLRPYVEVMEQLATLDELTKSAGVSPLGRRILDHLVQSAKPLSATALRAAVGGSRSLVTRELASLAERGLVERHVRRSRVTWVVAGASATEPPAREPVATGP
jgi:MarR family